MASTLQLTISSDVELVGEVSAILATPRAAPADSFVLHAPLELIARTALLPFVRAEARDEARRRIAEVGVDFEQTGPPIDDHRSASVFHDVTDAARSLSAAIDRGELDDVDAAAAWLGRSAQPHELAPLLADTLIPRLSAAGHAPIFLELFPRVAPRGELSGSMLRQLCREVARHPDWRLRWVDERPPVPAATADELKRALAAAPTLGRPDSSFIYPVMSRIDRADFAGAVLGPVTGGGSGVDVTDRGRMLLRIAAWSMLHEPGPDAPYGWSHCLTMPQAVLALRNSSSDPSMALAVAATHVLGFRAAFAADALRTEPDWDEQDTPLSAAIAEGPEVARAAMWHSRPADRLDAVTCLASFASVHADAHLVKYTLACLDAAADDPRHARLFLAAAATLAGWWAVQPGTAEH